MRILMRPAAPQEGPREFWTSQYGTGDLVL